VYRAQHHRHVDKLHYSRLREHLNWKYVYAAFDGLHMRLLGIALTSFSAGEWTKNYECAHTPTHFGNFRRSRLPVVWALPV
jgi:hypothetical protein